MDRQVGADRRGEGLFDEPGVGRTGPAGRLGVDQKSLQRDDGPRGIAYERTTRGPFAFGLPASKLPADRAAWYTSPDCPLPAEAR